MAHTVKLDEIQAFVFDAYGTLFDVNAAASHCQNRLGEKWQPLADTWRLKQLQYTWLRSLMGEYVNFWQITGDALDFALASLNISDADLRAELMDLYMRLDAYPEVPEVMASLKARGYKTAILSNGSPEMLAAAVTNAGLDQTLDAVLSVHDLGIFKPAPQVYQMAVDTLKVDAGAICFQSSNAWDAHAAAAFGFRVAWINRFKQSRERLPGTPDLELPTLSALLPALQQTQA